MALKVSKNVSLGNSMFGIFKQVPVGIQKFPLERLLLYKKFSESKNKLAKSAVVKKISSPLIIENIQSGQKLKEGQIRIGVHCCSVNVSDYLMWVGLSEVKQKIPFIPGFEISGEIIEKCDQNKKLKDTDSDDEEELRVGDRVLALNKVFLNGFSSECIVEKTDVFRIPNSIDYRTAAALADSYGTAMLGISRRAKVQQHETVLITAAAGGLGLAAVDIAANVYKAKVIGVCGTEDKAALVREKGAWAAFTYRNDKRLKDEVHKISNGKGADVVFDSVGGSVFKSAMECVTPEGKVIVAGFTSRDVPQLPMSDLLKLPSFNLIGVSLSNYRNNMLPVYRRTISDVIEICEQGLINPQISQIFSLDDINDAFNYLSEKKSTGKVVVEIVQR